MNENFYNSRKMRSVNASGELNKNGNSFNHNQINARQPINHNSSNNHLAQNILPQLVNLISPQIPVSQSANQTLINMGFNATPFLQNQLYSIPNTFGTLNTLASQTYGTNNVSYMNNMRINHTQPSSQTIMNFKDNKINQISNDANNRKNKSDGVMKNNQNPIKSSNYPVRLLINSELVGPLIGRKGEKIKEITANTGAKIDIKRESVPYSQFGLNNYMFSGCNRKGGNGDNGDQIIAGNNANRGESQIVFIVSEPEKCSAAISEIMQLCTQESKEQGREEPNMGLLAEDRFCARLIGKEGRFLNWVRCKSGSQVHVSNVPTITTLSEQPHIISLDRIISCRGGGLASLLEAEKLISDKIRQCVSEDNAQKPCIRMAKDDSFLPPRAMMYGGVHSGIHGGIQGPHTGQVHPPHLGLHEELLTNRRAPMGFIGSGIVHKANPNWPDNLKLDENLYVRIPQICAGSIIGSEGKSVRRIMAETGTYIQISKSNLGLIESIPAVHTYRKQSVPESMIKDELNERLITIKGSAPNQCAALTHIYSRVRICYNQSNIDEIQQASPIRLWVIIRVPKLMLGRLIGKEGKVIRQLQLSSRSFLSFPRLKLSLDPTDCGINQSALVKTATATATIDCSNGSNNANHDVSAGGDGATDSGHLQDDTITTSCINEDSMPTIVIPTAPLSATTAGSVVPSLATNKGRNSSTHTNETLHNPDLALFGDLDLHPVEIFGTYESVETAIYMIRRLVYSSIFSQFGPALIPGPTSSQLPGPHHPHHPHHPSVASAPPPFQQMPPPPPPPLLMPPSGSASASLLMSSSHPRRNSDCLSSAPHSFFNNIPHNIHPAAAAAAAAAAATAFMQQAIRAPHLSKHYNNNNKKAISYSQRSKSDHRSQSDSKVKIEIDEIVDSKCLEDDVVFKEDNNLNGINPNLESDCSNLSPKCVLLKGHQEASSGIFPALETQFAQASGHSREDLSQIFSATSPCSYYTDCCPNTPNYLNMSANEEMSFITAQESFSSMNDSFNDPSHSQQQHTQSSQSPLQTPSQQSSSSSSQQQQQQQQPPPTQSQQPQSFQHWSSSPNPPY